MSDTTCPHCGLWPVGMVHWCALHTTYVSTSDLIADFISKPNEDGTPCSADRQVLADRIRRGEHRK